MSSKIYIVIVNYKTPELVFQCLESLNQQHNALNGGKVIVVDNCSRDGSAEKLDAYVQSNGWNSWVNVLSMPRNGGFAYGCNAGIRHIFALDNTVDYVMLLNPDTLVRVGAIKSLSDFMDANAHVGIAGSQIENSDGGIENSAHRFHSPMSELIEGARLGLLNRLFHQYGFTGALWAIVVANFVSFPLVLFYKIRLNMFSSYKELITVPVFFVGMAIGKIILLLLRHL